MNDKRCLSLGHLHATSWYHVLFGQTILPIIADEFILLCILFTNSSTRYRFMHLALSYILKGLLIIPGCPNHGRWSGARTFAALTEGRVPYSVSHRSSCLVIVDIYQWLIIALIHKS